MYVRYLNTSHYFLSSISMKVCVFFPGHAIMCFICVAIITLKSMCLSHSVSKCFLIMIVLYNKYRKIVCEQSNPGAIIPAALIDAVLYTHDTKQTLPDCVCLISFQGFSQVEANIISFS